jgi:hypothetical protein
MVASIPLAFLWNERPRSEKSVPEQLFRCQHPRFKGRNVGHPRYLGHPPLRFVDNSGIDGDNGVYEDLSEAAQSRLASLHNLISSLIGL